MGIFCRLRRASSAEVLDLDKNWEFVQFVLTGRTDDDGFLVGPARFGVDEVHAMSAAFDALDDASIGQRLASHEITACYPCNEAVPHLDEDDVALIRALSNEVRAFVRACSTAHDVLVVEMY